MEIINYFDKKFENERSSKKKKLFDDKEAFKKALRNKKIIVPGLKMKLARLAAKIIPEWISVKVTYHFQRKKDGQC